MALAGEIEMFADCGLEEPGLGDCLNVPPPQANCHTIRNAIAIREKRVSMTSSNPSETSAGTNHTLLGKTSSVH